MTIDEAKDFLHQAFIAFPGVWEWLKSSSIDIEATVEVWAKNLSKVSAAEAISVLNRWNANEIPPPSGYQRELFVNHVIAVVQKDRMKTYSAKHREEVFDQLNLRGRKESYLPVLGPMMRDIMGIKAQWELGQIPESEMHRLVEERKQQALEAVSR
jgi:hypothetical protein